MNFSKTMPDLVEPQVDIMVQNITQAKINHSTFSENICGSLQNFYDNYFKKYFFFLLLITIVILFLLYRYYKNKELKKFKQAENIKGLSLNKTSNEIQTEQDRMAREIYEILKQKKVNNNTNNNNNNNYNNNNNNRATIKN